MNVDKPNQDKHVQERRIETVIEHPRYHAFKPTINDIALLRMDKKVTFTRYVRPLCLDYKGVFKEQEAIATGHGLTAYSRILYNY